MEEVKEAIGIDKVNMDGNTIFIEEHHNANANFVLEAITSHCMDKNIVTCYVLFHNTFGHFHNVGMKFGYNLKELSNSNVKVIEPLKMISKNIHNLNSDLLDDSTSEIFDIKSEGNILVKQLVQIIMDKCKVMKSEISSRRVYLIIEDLSHLIDLGLNLQDIWLFIRYIRSFVNIEPHFTLCISSHIYKATSQELYLPNLIAIGLQHFSDLVIRVQPLESGYSKSVSGKVIICWKLQHERLKFKWLEEMVYLFKLYDRQVKLFTPGCSNIM